MSVLPAWLSRWCCGYHTWLVTGERGFKSRSRQIFFQTFTQWVPRMWSHLSLARMLKQENFLYMCVWNKSRVYLTCHFYYYLASHNTVFTQRHLNTRGVGRIWNSYANTRRLRKYVLVRFTNIVKISDFISYERIIPPRPEFIKLFVVPI